MDAAEKQLLLDENARLLDENAVLRRTINALSRRIFGTSSEKLDAAQLELLLDSGDSKKPPPPIPQTQDRRLTSGTTRSGLKDLALHASPTNRVNWGRMERLRESR